MSRRTMTYAQSPPWGIHRFSEHSERPRHGRGPRGRGGYGPAFGPGGPRGRGRRRRGDVRLGLLLLLAEEPRNGYQLMEAIEDRTAGRWRPSPGSVYPTLAQLEDEGLIRSTERDGAKVFELTEAGSQKVAERGDAPAPWDEAAAPGDEARQDLRSVIHQVMHAVHEVTRVGDEAQIDRARKVLAEARRALYLILAGESEE